jgi:hypothetical protein
MKYAVYQGVTVRCPVCVAPLHRDEEEAHVRACMTIELELDRRK